MRRSGLLLLVMTVLALTAEGKAQQQRQQEIQTKITDLYVSGVGKALDLTDEQFLRINGVLRRFMNMRFANFAAARDVDLQIARLSNQRNPSDADVRMLTEAKADIEQRVATMNRSLLEKIQMEIQLTPKQRINFLNFQKVFFDQKLPGLLEMARQQTIGKPQNPPPPDRPNVGKAPNNPPNNPGRPGDAFRPPQRGKV